MVQCFKLQYMSTCPCQWTAKFKNVSQMMITDAQWNMQACNEAKGAQLCAYLHGLQYVILSNREL